MERLIIGREGFSLPLELVTSTQAILARKRSGKSYTASVEAEEMLAANQQIAVIDPTSAWWGLRSSADGEGEGYPVVVFGGDHADAPLDFRSGKAMAAALVEHGFSAIFDLGSLETDEQVEFVMHFCSELLRINKNAMHVFMDEADTFAPQQGSKLQVKCRGTVSRLVKQGGIKGVGFTMITQRSASLSWDVLSQVDILTILRMSAPHDINPVSKWLQSETTKEFAAQVAEELPRLPVGVAFVASAPHGIAERIDIRQRRTFNSGATPKPGERKAEPKAMANIDIQKLGREITASVEKMRQESPEYLKQRIHELEQQVAKGGTADMGVLEDVQRMEAELEELRPLRERVPQLEREIQHRNQLRAEFITRLQQVLVEFTPESDETKISATPTPPAAAVSRAIYQTPHRESDPVTHEGINAPQQRILDAIATLHATRAGSVTLEWIATTAGTTPRARGFEENMRQLKAKGLVSGTELTEAGKSVASASSTLPTFEGVLARLAVMLPEPQIRMLRQLKRGAHAAETLAEAMGTTTRARGFEENTRQLRRREYIVMRSGNYALVGWLQELR